MIHILQKKLFYFLCLITTSTSTLIAQNQSAIIGNWQDIKNPDKQISLYYEIDGQYYGKVLNEEKVDGNKSKLIFKNLEWQEESNAYKGKIINPDNGKEYKTTIYMEGNDQFKFKVSVFIFSRTFRFKRINS